MPSFFFQVGVGLVAWLLVYTSPNIISQFHFDTPVNQHNVITPQLSTLIKNTLALENVTGLSVAIVPKHGEPEFHTWGYRTENGDEVTPDTLFHMASLSKAFCATALGLLIDDFANGRNVTALPTRLTELTWHTRLGELLPDWQLMDEWASERANLKDILSHVSGLPRHDTAYGPKDTPHDVITRLKHLRPAFELREQWSYNNIMYTVAAHIIVTYSGQPYTLFVEERIFTPLGMTSTTFSPTKAEATGKFTQGWTGNGRRVPEVFDEDLAFLMAGPGGIISDAIDMAKWIATWINEGVYENHTVIPPSVYKNVSYSYSVSTDHQIDPEYSTVGYGMGWHRSSYRGHNVVYHGGSLPGLSALVSFLPNDEIGVTLFANAGNKAEPLRLILDHILDSALHLTSPSTQKRSPSPNVTKTEPHTHDTYLSLDTFAGTYVNPGYGSLTLCGPSNTSSYCAEVQSNFSIIDGQQGNPAPSMDLLAHWPHVWSSHLRLRHQQGPVFSLYFTTLYPNGYGKDTTPFETREIGVTEGVAEFVVEDGEVVGFGMSGLVGQVTELARRGGRVQDRAEVWFDRV